jgi:aminopeptidase N
MTYLDNHRGGLLHAEKQSREDGDQAAQYSLVNSPDDFYVQAKAMNVWWMLRDMVGENALIAALHNYKAAEDTSAYYMQKLIEAQAHRNLAWFFDDWVYRDRGLPDFRIEAVYPRELAAGGYMVTVTVENLGGSAAEVPVTLKMAATESSDRLMVPGKSKASIRIQTPAMPQEAVVNDGSVPEIDTNNNIYRISTESK